MNNTIQHNIMYSSKYNCCNIIQSRIRSENVERQSHVNNRCHLERWPEDCDVSSGDDLRLWSYIKLKISA